MPRLSREVWGLRPFRCKHCKRQYSGFDRFKRHTWYHKKWYCMKRNNNPSQNINKADLNCFRHVENSTERVSCESTQEQDCRLPSGSFQEINQHRAFETTQTYLKDPCSYKCRVQACRKLFQNQHDFIIHMRSHTVDRPVLCNRCYLPFKDVGPDLKKHVIDVHDKIIINGKKVYQCKYCNVLFERRSSFASHKYAHKEHCDSLEFIHASQLVCPCPKCNMGDVTSLSSPAISNQTPGMPTEHDKATVAFTVKVAEVNVKNVRDPLNDCDNFCRDQACRKLFQNQHDFIIHVRSHTVDRPVVCNRCYMPFKDVGHLKRHFINVHDKIIINGKKVYQCKYCNVLFERRSSFASHKYAHKEHCDSLEFINAGQLVCPCPMCNVGDVTSVSSPAISNQTPGMPMELDKATATFPIKVAEVNVKNVGDPLNDSDQVCASVEHNVSILYPCLRCSMAFGTMEDLSRHEVIQRHVDEVFVCRLCKMVSSSQTIIADHIIHTHDKVIKRNGNIQFRCIFCATLFAKEDQIREHKIVHSDATGIHADISRMDSSSIHACYCHFCNAVYAIKGGFSSHMKKIHPELLKSMEEDVKQRHAEAPQGRNVCLFCKKEFTQKSALINHEIVHKMKDTPENPPSLLFFVP